MGFYMDEKERTRMWWTVYKEYLKKSHEFREHAKVFEGKSLTEMIGTPEWDEHVKIGDEACKLMGQMMEISRIKVDKK